MIHRIENLLPAELQAPARLAAEHIGSRAPGPRALSARVAAALVLSLLGGIAPRAWGETAVTHAPIRVAQRRLFEVGGLPGQPAAARAAAINQRIDSFVRHPERIAPVDVKLRGPEEVLTMARQDLLTVTRQDAADNLTTVPELAQSWRRELDEALSSVRAERETLWNQIGLTIIESTDNLIREAAALIPRLVSTLLVLLITLGVARYTRTTARRALAHSHIDQNSQQLIRTLLYLAVWVIGWLLALGTLGVNPATLVAGLGVTTIALGFALKDLLSNFVAGFLILTTRPFRLGDQIVVNEYEGTVERIDLRATILRALDNRLIVIPNADVYTATLINNTASPYRRQEIVIGIDYNADLDQAEELALKVAAETPGVLPEPAPDVLVDELAPGSVKLKLRFHIDSLQWNSLKVSSELQRRLKAASAAAGIRFAASDAPSIQPRVRERVRPGKDGGLSAPGE
jgi:small conductance mechanosensitive channel